MTAFIQNESTYQSFFQSIAVPFLTIDTLGTITLFNPASETLFGYSQDEILGKNICSLMLEGTESIFQKKMLPIISHNSNTAKLSHDFTAKKKDGGECSLRLHLTKATFSGETVFAINFQALKENSLNENSIAPISSNDKFENLKKEFVSLMNQNLRGPLNSVIGFGKLLAMDKNKLSNIQHAYIEKILESSNILRKSINQIIELSDLESGNVEPNTKPTNIHKLINESLAHFDGLIAERRITIENKITEKNAVEVLADRKYLKSALSSLLANAIQYNIKGGKISIFVQKRNNGKLRLNISDTGFGIPDNKEEKLFTLFGRVSEISTPENYGIGLYSAKKIIQLLDGEIGYYKNEKQGSTFWIELKETQEKDDKLMETTYTDSVDSSLNNCNILYIEDDQANIDLMRLTLRKRKGLSLQYCMTAEEGIEQASERHPDLIIMDMNLPGMNGLEAIQELKKNKDTSSIPVVLLSSSKFSDYPNLEYLSSFTHQFSKPIDLNKLDTIMSDILIGNPLTQSENLYGSKHAHSLNL